MRNWFEKCGTYLSTDLQCNIEIRLNGIEGLQNGKNLLNSRVVVLVKMVLENIYYGLETNNKQRVVNMTYFLVIANQRTQITVTKRVPWRNAKSVTDDGR